MKIVGHGCSLDCFDVCKFNVHVDNGSVVKIEGDKNHPYTKGMICIKGKKHIERLNHKDRIYKPLKKVNGQWIEISFEEAIDLISEKLLYYKENYSSNSVIHYAESGAGGTLKGIEDIFFNFYGGITKSEGSTCWSAGMTAQKYDFGDVRGHLLEDMFNSKNIIVWGRNPYNTSIHLMDMLKKSKNRGIKVIVIDPIYTDTAKQADEYIRINPGSDGALAMAMTKIIIEDNLLDENFIKENVMGFEEYKNYLKKLDLSYLASECGVDIKKIRELANIYAKEKYSTIYVGYGIQRYRNGGNIVRAIDAMASICGAIGKKGGGVNYANRVYKNELNLDPYNSNKYAKNERYFNVHEFSDFISNKDNNIKCIFVSKANPLCQLPNLNKFIEKFKNVEFKICIDMFMTDTAKHCDLFIPCTNTLESEDIIYSSMNNPYIIYNEIAIKPKHELMDEYYFFMEIAKKMNIKEYPIVSKKEYINKIIEPLNKYNIDLDTIKNENITIQKNEVVWEDLEFKTNSKKIEIYSEKAKLDGLSPIPIYDKYEHDNKLRLISTHPKNSLFTQHVLDVDDISNAYINEETIKKYNVVEGDIVLLKSKNGEIRTKIKISEDIPNNVIHMYVSFKNNQGNLNFLTDDICSEMGYQVAYNDTFVDIVKKC